MNQYCAIQRAENTADIFIFGDITRYPYAPDGEASAASVAQQLRDLDVEQINVHIDSYGGSVSEGWGIYNVLRAHKAAVTTYADGFVASAALYPFLAGDKRVAGSVSAFFLHRVMTGADGYSDDLRAAADMAEKMTEIGVNAFVERAGMSRETVLRLMDGETWLTPLEALDYGIATAMERSRDEPVSQSVKRQIIQRAMGKDSPRTPRTNEETPDNSVMRTLAGIFYAKNERSKK